MYKYWNGIYIACMCLLYRKTTFMYLIKSDSSLGKPVDMYCILFGCDPSDLNLNSCFDVLASELQSYE
jgi:hypothetical protein